MVGSQSVLSQTKHLFADDSAGADFCHGHQTRALEQSCHFPPASITPLVAVAEVARSQQGLGAPWGPGAVGAPGVHPGPVPEYFLLLQEQADG